MNNSKIAYSLEEKEEKSTLLEEQEGQLAQIVEAINRIEASTDWQKLKRLVLDGVLINLERRLKIESEKTEVNVPELYRLQGQLVWARKYADLKKLEEFFKQSLKNIKLKINEKNPRDGAL